MLELINFIKDNKCNFRQKLTDDPYNLRIKENNDLVIFNYDFIDSGFRYKLVQEARGIILEKDTWNIVCYPFNKFFNYEESLATDINWDTAKVQEKIDGSLIKLYHHNGLWIPSTMSTITAYNAPIITDEPSRFSTFGDLFQTAMWEAELDIESLNTNMTYMFELASPYNKVVIPHKEIKLYHIGTRNNETLEEVEVDIGIQKPKEYNMNSIEEIKDVVSEIEVVGEGFVVVDDEFNRVKIKSPKYVAMQHLIEGETSDKSFLKIIMSNEQKEFLSYLPEYKEDIERVEKGYNNLLQQVEENLGKADTKMGSANSRKQYALWAKKTIMPSILFEYLDDKIDKENYKEFIKNFSHDKLLTKIKQIEEWE